MSPFSQRLARLWRATTPWSSLIGAGMFDILGHLDYIRSRASGLLAPRVLDLRLPLVDELA